MSATLSAVDAVPPARACGGASSYGLYLAKRLDQFILVVFIGVNVAYLITHATPVDPVEQTIAAATSFGNTSPEAIATMRDALRALYRTGGSPLQQ